MLFLNVGKIQRKNKLQSIKTYKALESAPEIAPIFFMSMIFLENFWLGALADRNGSDFIKACARLEDIKFEWLNKVLVMYFFHRVKLGKDFTNAIQFGLNSFFEIHIDDQNDFWIMLSNKNDGESLLIMWSLVNKMLNITANPDYFIYHMQHSYELAPKNITELLKYVE